jgi:hypothetical protein
LRWRRKKVGANGLSGEEVTTEVKIKERLGCRGASRKRSEQARAELGSDWDGPAFPLPLIFLEKLKDYT